VVAATKPAPFFSAKKREKLSRGLLGAAIFLCGALFLFILAGAVATRNPSKYAALLIVSLFVVIGVLLFRFISLRHPEEPWLFQFGVLGLLSKLLASFARYQILIQVYGGNGDATRYDKAGSEYAWAVVSGGDIPELTELSKTFFVERFTGWVYLGVGPDMLAGFFIYAILAFIGTYLWYRGTAEVLTVGFNRRRYFLLLMFMPSLLFWPSSIGKEALMLFGLGFFIWGASLAMRRRYFLALILCAASGWFIGIIRPHVVALYAAAFVFAFVFGRLGPSKSTGGGLARGFVTVLAVLLLILVSSRALDFLGVEDLSTDAVQARVVEQNRLTFQGGSSFGSGPVSLVPSDLVVGVFTVFFRPMIYEAHSLLMMITALESTFLLLYLGVRFSSVWCGLKNLRRRPFLLFMLGAALLYGVAFSSFLNFGLLARQRSLVLPALFVFACIVPAERSEEAEKERSSGSRGGDLSPVFPGPTPSGPGRSHGFHSREKLAYKDSG